MLDPQKLRVIREIARTGTIAEAATILGFTASAASQQVSTLERQLGTQLLERYPRSVRLTEAGRVLAEHAERVLSEIQLAERAVSDVANVRGGRLRVAAFSSAADPLVVPAMSAFVRRYPDIDLSFTEIEPELALDAVLSGQVDLAVTHQYEQLPGPQLHGLRQTLLMSEKLLLALPPRMQTSVQDPVHLGQYADVVWISSVIPEGFQALTELACRLAGFEPSIKFRADTYDTILDFVAADFGPALVPAIAARPRTGVRYRDISYPPDLKRLTHLTVRDTRNSPAMDAMIDILHRRLKQLPRFRPALKATNHDLPEKR